MWIFATIPLKITEKGLSAKASYEKRSYAPKQNQKLLNQKPKKPAPISV